MLCRAKNRGRLGMPGFSCKCCRDFGPGANPIGRRLLKRRERGRWHRDIERQLVVAARAPKAGSPR